MSELHYHDSLPALCAQVACCVMVGICSMAAITHYASMLARVVWLTRRTSAQDEESYNQVAGVHQYMRTIQVPGPAHHGACRFYLADTAGVSRVKCCESATCGTRARRHNKCAFATSPTRCNAYKPSSVPSTARVRTPSSW